MVTKKAQIKFPQDPLKNGTSIMKHVREIYNICRACGYGWFSLEPEIECQNPECGSDDIWEEPQECEEGEAHTQIGLAHSIYNEWIKYNICMLVVNGREVGQMAIYLNGQCAKREVSK